MPNRREFEIAFVGLKPGIHTFDYQIKDKFFAPYGEQDFTNCNVSIKLQLDKTSGFIMLKFDVDGKVDVVCDRCGNPLTLRLWDEFNLIVKMVDEPGQMNEQEEDPDIYYISKGESHLHLADWIYEFINLSIPMQKSCSEDEIGGPQCNNEVLEKLKQMEAEASKTANSVWKGLDQFKDLQ
ncbi:MAG: YceD family protein [Chitinophagaceae bacterium]